MIVFKSARASSEVVWNASVAGSGSRPERAQATEYRMKQTIVPCEVEDTYAEAFRSIYAEILVTCRDRRWLQHGINAVTGHSSSTILCDCESGVDRFVGPGGDESFVTTDGRPESILEFHAQSTSRVPFSLWLQDVRTLTRSAISRQIQPTRKTVIDRGP